MSISSFFFSKKLRDVFSFSPAAGEKEKTSLEFRENLDEFEQYDFSEVQNVKKFLNKTQEEKEKEKEKKEAEEEEEEKDEEKKREKEKKRKEREKEKKRKEREKEKEKERLEKVKKKKTFSTFGGVWGRKTFETSEKPFFGSFESFSSPDFFFGEESLGRRFFFFYSFLRSSFLFWSFFCFLRPRLLFLPHIKIDLETLSLLISTVPSSGRYPFAFDVRYLFAVYTGFF